MASPSIAERTSPVESRFAVTRYQNTMLRCERSEPLEDD